MRTIGPREIAQLIRALTALKEDPGLVPNTHAKAQSSTCNSTFKRTQLPLLIFSGWSVHITYTHMYTHTK